MRASVPVPESEASADILIQRYRQVRAVSEAICRPLAIEDYGLQTMTEASPAKWHLAHTTWYFETFVLVRHCKPYRPSQPAYAYLFNSYYNGVGAQFPRARRGWLSRPTVAEVYAWRQLVDQAMEAFIEALAPGELEIRFIIELGLHHEQQHQELMLTDLKYNLAQNPLRPVYRSDLQPVPAGLPLTSGWSEFAGGDVEVGHDGRGFAFDNEHPRHAVRLAPFRLARRLVTNAEYLAFIADDGYQRPELWLADGWNEVCEAGWRAPLYWWREQGDWWQFTLGGPAPLVGSQPVVHVSFYEADAFARWRNSSLPLEGEWEQAAAAQAVVGNFADSDYLQPTPAGASESAAQLFGDAWEWTNSPYQAYPGYQAFAGDLGEYNGKFMCNQMVLRGGSCASPAGHLRASYRNFFYPRDRWQFSGIRLAER